MKFLLDEEKKMFAPISDRAPVTKTLALDSIPCLAFHNKKGQCEDSIVCSDVVTKYFYLSRLLK